MEWLVAGIAVLTWYAVAILLKLYLGFRDGQRLVKARAEGTNGQHPPKRPPQMHLKETDHAYRKVSEPLDH